MSKISVKTQEKRFPTVPDLYGLFFEDISRAGDGGIYPEMLRNRSYEDSLMPEGCHSEDGGKTFLSPTGWIDEFNNGEGMDDWVKDNAYPPTDIPAWYVDNASMALDETDVLNENRKVSLAVKFAPGGSLKNIGYAGVPQKAGEAYKFYCFAKADAPVKLIVSTVLDGKTIDSAEITVSGGWARYDVTLTSNVTTGDAAFVLTAPEGGELKLGFSSLMPADTFMGHGLRKDLMELLRDMHPAFLRFPGGCIVEGFTLETAMFFRKTVGPVWERPSHQLLWHYRSTNGLGFHEYLQFCEDLNLSPLYVCNCGMTCQGRMPYYFNEEEQEDITQDTLNALEYALGDETTEWGSLRAKMGHPAPFKLKYLEIGNENWGDEYAWRFEAIRKRVLEKYPELIIVANAPDPRLTADIVDDHYYNMPEFYAENVGIYDDYDRTKPNIFVGEFSVNQTYEGQIRGAVAEAMFMVGFERNQDVVKLVSYAPLFEHLHYGSWYPNLLIYDNYRSYGIPSYYAFKVFGKNRGDQVVAHDEEHAKIYRDLHGLPFVSTMKEAEFTGAVWNGQPVAPVKDLDYSKSESIDGVTKLCLVKPEDGPFASRPVPAAVALGSMDDLFVKEGDFSVRVKEAADAVSVGILCAPKPLSFYDRNQPIPTDPWRMFNLEPIRLEIKDGMATVLRGFMRAAALSDAKPVAANDGWYEVRSVYTTEHALFYVNGELVHDVELPNYPAMVSVATDTEKEVFVKIVNFADTEDNVEITLDCDVEAAYTVDRFYGPADAENTIEDPTHVCDETVALTGAAKTFTYTAPAMSVNVVKLIKK